MANLFVVEPDQEIRRLIGLVLGGAGHQVVGAVRNLKELDSPPLDRVDLIFCDVGFLNDGDLACIKDLKRLFPSARIVGLSAAIHGKQSGHLVQTPAEAGLQGILSKPFSIQALLEVAGDALR